MSKHAHVGTTLACGVLIAAGLFVLYFLGMGAYPLTDVDEPVYGQVAKEMAAGAGWLTPHYGGEMWFDKPPLFYWLSGLSVSALGPSELACRAPSAMLAVALVFLVYALAAYDFGKRAGVFAALAMATCLQTIILARACVTDITFVFCLTCGLYGLRRWIDAERRARYGWGAFAGAMTGLAMLAKGPVAPVLVGVTILVYLAWTRKLRRLVSGDAFIAVAAMLIVGMPWYAAMYLMHREKFVEGFLVANNLTRFLKAEHAEQTGGWYSYFLNFPILLVFFFPWSVFLPQAIRRHWRASEGARLLIVWFAVVFAFFSISKTILVTYIYPIYPAAAVFVGALWGSAASDSPGARRSVIRGLWAALVFAAMVGAGAVLSAKSKYPEAATAAAVLGAILIAMSIVALAVSRRSMRTPAWAIGVGMAVFAAWLMVGIMPVVSEDVSTSDLVSRLPSISGAKLVEYHLKKPSIVFYTGVRPERTQDSARLARLAREHDKLVVFCRSSAGEAMESLGLRRLAMSADLAAYGRGIPPKGE